VRVLRQPLPEPSVQVIQNLTIGDFPLGPAFEPWQELGGQWYGENVLQGEWTTSRMPGIAVPSTMIGWNPYFAQPNSIGPMAIQGGIVGMVPIGPGAPVNPRIDPQQIWLASQTPLDAVGQLYGPWPMLPSLPAPAFDRVLSNDEPLAAPAAIANPRREVKDSGLLKVIMAAQLPEEFGRAIQLLYPPQQSYQEFTLTGTTISETLVPVGDCRVIAYQSGWRYVEGGTKIIAETVSDGSGNFTLLLRNIDYQLIAYKEGAPDLGGLTRQDVTPIVATTIYMRDPTVPGGGGGGTFPAVGDVDLGVVYGPVDNLIGTLVQPAAGDVQAGVGYGASGTEFTGTFAAPAVGDVDLGVGYGAGGVEFTGTLLQADANDVRNNVNYGAGGIEFNGDLVLPLPGDVEAGVGYGADGTELLGTVTLPAAANVTLGVQYGADGTEFTGTAVGGGGATTAYTPRRSR
jgi:hypothetical protein